MAIPVFSHNSSSHSNRAYRRIRLRPQLSSVAERIQKEHNTGSIISRVLAARGYECDDALRHFISPSLREGLPEPSKLLNLGAACKAIATVHKDGGSIAICCDFDVDGLSGGSVVHGFFNDVGISSKVFVPDRFTDGYGLNERMVREIAEQGFKLLLTIDYGTTNVRELTLARELGLTTVVIDHHHVGGKNPPADIFVNPNQDGCGFADKIACAAGLAWYLVVGLRTELGLQTIDARKYLDLACLGTICDMVPLIGMNRVIAKRGLELLTETRRPGLRALKNVMGVKRAVECSDISFGIGPRLNAAGRIVHGDVVVELLTTGDSVRAEKLAKQLNDLNAERQEIENTVKLDAISMIDNDGGPKAGLVVWNPEFHTGVIGIVAQRLVETFYRPAAVMGMDTEGIFKGSVRGIKGFNVVETLSAVGEHLIKFGGHEGAGGFSVAEEKLEAFRDAFIAACAARLGEIETVPYVDADTETTIAEVTIPAVKELKDLAPFGMGNPAPQLLLRKLRVIDVKELKGAHLKAILTDGNRYITGMMWRQTNHPDLYSNAIVDIVGRPEVSTWNGNTEIQIHIQAVEQHRQ